MKHIEGGEPRVSLLAAPALATAASPVAEARNPDDLFPCLSSSGEGTIGGTVRDANGAPLRKVGVTAYATTGQSSIVSSTDAAGVYTFTKVPIGSYLLKFKPRRGPFQVAWYNSRTSPIDATPVVVNAGVTTGGIDATLPAGAQFNVTLRDAEGDPVPQFEIVAYDRYAQAVAGGLTDRQGQALTSPGLPVGDYRLFARPAGDSTMPARSESGSGMLAQYHNRQPSLDDADQLTITRASDSVDVRMTLQRGARLSGTATDAATGAPLAGVYVSVSGADLERDALTDAQGRYSVAGIPSGIYRVQFLTLKRDPAALAPLSRLVTLSAPHEQSGIDAPLTPGGTISGHVGAPDGTPISNVEVSVVAGDDEIGGGLTAADGSYTI